MTRRTGTPASAVGDTRVAVRVARLAMAGSMLVALPFAAATAQVGEPKPARPAAASATNTGTIATNTATPAAPVIAEAPPPPPPAVTPLARAIEAVLSGTPRLVAAETGADLTDADIEATRAFYVARGSDPLWMGDDGLTVRGRMVIDEFARADDWGLRAADLAVTGVDIAERTPEALARAEIRLTAAVLKYARHARGGRISNPEGLLSGYIDRRPQLLPVRTVLDGLAFAAAPDAYVRGLNPQHRQFELLRQAYLKARDQQASRASLVLPMGGDVRPGNAHPQVSILRRRLGIPTPTTAVDGLTVIEDVYDPALVAAVKAFQVKAGLRGDGVIGDRTRRALNAAAAPTTDRLLANMELWRWMPETLGETRIEVNIPEFEVRFHRAGRQVHAERVVVGTLETATPIFSDEMETVVFKPKWGVPDSIKIGELLPSLRAGRGLKGGLRMAKNGREVNPYSIDWNRADITQYHVYQPSGDDNALGIVKFLFPNRHAVYLHDTPSKHLFGAGTRTFSHGCIRVRNPIRLAEMILDTDKGWPTSQVRKLTDSGPDDNTVRLTTRIPVHITYFTAVADETTGDVRYVSDVYGHEKRVTLALEGRFDRIVKLDPKPPVAKPVEVARRRDPRFQPPSALGYGSNNGGSWSWLADAPPSVQSTQGRGRPAAPSPRRERSDPILNPFGLPF